jgi:hypothetical protein
MKKISLLIIICISVLAASAQSSRIGSDNLQVKNPQISTSVSADEFIENITVYPNPVVDVLKVTFKSNKNSVGIISIFNNIGKQVFTQESEIEPGNNIISIDIRSKNIEPGIYFVQYIAEKQVFTRKLIVK